MSGPEDNMEMIKQVKSEVKKLSKKSVVAAKVLLYERELDKFERKVRLQAGDLVWYGTEWFSILLTSEKISNRNSVLY